MNKKYARSQIGGFVFVCIFGTLLHFLYEWSGNNKIVGIFSPVNESVFEHLKLLFFPFLAFAVFQFIFFSSRQKGFFSSKLIGVLSGMIFITAFYYTYSGIIGKTIMWCDILSFFLGVLVAFTVDWLVLKSEKTATGLCENLAILSLAAVSSMFFIFTFAPPLIPLFKDAVEGTYGI